MSVRIIDKEVRKAFEKTIAEIDGKRSWKVSRIFKKYKSRRLDEPWNKKGISESGGGGKWPDNARSTVQKKNPGRFQPMWHSDAIGETVPMAEALANYNKYMRGGGYMEKAQIPHVYFRSKLMYDKGNLKRDLTVRWSKKKKQFWIGPKSGSKSRKYAWVHLFGWRGTRTITTKRWEGRGGNKHLVLRSKTINANIPKRQWAVWTNKDMAEFTREFKKWFADNF